MNLRKALMYSQIAGMTAVAFLNAYHYFSAEMVECEEEGGKVVAMRQIIN